MLTIAENYRPYQTDSPIWDGRRLIGEREKPKPKPVKRDPYSLRQLSLQAGRCHAYFSNTRKNKKQLWDFYLMLGDGCPLAGYRAMPLWLKEIEKEFFEAVDKLREHRAVKRASRELFNSGQSLYSTIRETLRTGCQSYDGALRLQEIIKWADENLEK